MEKVFCAGCKFAPDNIIWADRCLKECENTVTQEGGFVKMRELNKSHNCPFYKKNFGAFIEDTFKKLSTKDAKVKLSNEK